MLRGSFKTLLCPFSSPRGTSGENVFVRAPVAERVRNVAWAGEDSPSPSEGEGRGEGEGMAHL